MSLPVDNPGFHHIDNFNTSGDAFESSPYRGFPRDDGGTTIRFRQDNKDIVDVTLDKDNRYKLAFWLLMPDDYAPSRKGVSVRLCQNESPSVAENCK